MVAVLFRTKKKTKLSFVQNGVGGLFFCAEGALLSSIARVQAETAPRAISSSSSSFSSRSSRCSSISARASRVPSTSFGFRATPRSDSFLTEKEAKETAKDHPAPEEEDDFFASPRRKPSSSSSSSSSSSAQQRARLDAGALLLLLFASGMKAVVPT